MRIAVIAHSAGRVGGVETYLATLIPALESRGHEVACWFETPEGNREPIVHGRTEVMSRAAAADLQATVDQLKAWKPDVTFSHGLRSLHLEQMLQPLARSVFFAHSYYGTCISGSKSHRTPWQQPCTRTFGPVCLGQYFPRRCGGLSPATMLSQYQLQRERQALLALHDRIVVASHHMLEEYVRHGFGASTAVVSLPAMGEERALGVRRRESPWRLLYLGRLEQTKGVRIALESAAALSERFPGISLQISGEGSLEGSLKKHAARLVGRYPGLSVDITGWLTADQVQTSLDGADLLLVPSLWPEPFGLVGLDAAARGVPAVAFDVGGIAEWLIDGHNGCLVPLPANVASFTNGIARCLSSETFQEMRRHSQAVARRFTMNAHLDRLEAVFRDVTGARRPAVVP